MVLRARCSTDNGEVAIKQRARATAAAGEENRRRAADGLLARVAFDNGKIAAYTGTTGNGKATASGKINLLCCTLT